MSIKEALGIDKQHIFDAQKIAEGLHRRKPNETIEMMAEIKAYLIVLKEKEIKELENI
jgi:hypothetical protein